jgi:hypothetical protein
MRMKAAIQKCRLCGYERDPMKFHRAAPLHVKARQPPATILPLLFTPYVSALYHALHALYQALTGISLVNLTEIRCKLIVPH